MSDNKKQIVGWRSLLAGFVLVSVIVVGYIYRNEEWTGFSKTEVITTTIEKDKQGQTLKTTISKQPHLGKTFWDWLDLLIVPVLLLFWAYKFQQIDKEREKKEKAKLEEADLREANLEKADLKESKMSYASLEKANLEGANLWGAEMFYGNLDGTILIDIKNLTPEQIKSTLFWKKAIYQGEWNEEKKTWVAIEPDNAKFIDDLKKDKSSDPRNSRFKIL